MAEIATCHQVVERWVLQHQRQGAPPHDLSDSAVGGMVLEFFFHITSCVPLILPIFTYHLTFDSCIGDMICVAMSPNWIG
jgi:hypothetical protein